MAKRIFRRQPDHQIAPVQQQPTLVADGSTFIYEVKSVDGVFCVEIKPGRLHPIKLESGALVGEPGTYAERWTPQFVYAGFAPVYLLEWSHVDGHRGIWYLDSDLVRVGGNDKEPPAPICSILRQKFGALASGIWQDLLCAKRPGLNKSARAFGRINTRTRSELMKLCAGTLPDELMVIVLRPALGQDRTISVFNGSSLVDLHSKHLLQILEEHTHIMDKAVVGLPRGALTWPSPVDGRPLATDAVLSLDDFRFAYRLVDDAHDLVFYIIAAGPDCEVLGVCFPASQRVFCAGAEATFHLFFPNLGRTILDHLLEFGKEIETYLAAPTRQLVCFIRSLHHGHLLFNDLAGIDRLVHELPPGCVPDFYVRSPSAELGDMEVYGKLEELFPVLEGKVHRPSPNFVSLLRHAYGEGHSLLRATLKYVPRRLADRVIEITVADPALEPDLRHVESIKAKAWPILVLDLRIENRTLVDLPGFYHRLLEFLLQQTSGVAVVLNGHTGAYVSPTDVAAPKPPIEVQRDIVAGLVKSFQGANVDFINNVGMGMRRAVFWCHHAHFFVGPWGASLVTYRWICNKPGLIMANKWNLQHGRGPRTDIYNLPEFMESPGPVTYLAAQHVRDLPNAPLMAWTLTGQAPETGYNFDVDEAAAFEEVRQLLDAYGPARTLS